MKIILASASIGRRKLLESLGLKFEVIASSIDEEKIVDADPVKMAVLRATAKAEDVASSVIPAKVGILVIGADTVGWLGNWVFNKPKSREEAQEVMQRLSGKTHHYVSGHCLIWLNGSMAKWLKNSRKARDNHRTIQPFNHFVTKQIADYDISSVTFRKLSKTDIDFYLDRVEYTKLCGALKIMNSPQNFVTATNGSLSNIIGISLEKLRPFLMEDIKA